MKLKKTLCLFLLFMFSIILLSSCSTINKNSEQGIDNALKKVYGDKKYTISFNAQNLEKPLKELKFSYNEIPKLPTPEKLGYIFLGWFFDSEYVRPYDDSSLILGMKDVNLYAKWQKEEFTQDGSYDIKFKTKILEDTIVKEELVDKYGGIKDFTKTIIEENTYIEKNGDDLLLRLEYNQKVFSKFGKSSPYKITVSQKGNDSNFYILNTIESLSDLEKTTFFNLKNVDITKPFYLDVSARDYETYLSNESDRDKMGSSYKIEFKITKFVGFRRAFANAKNNVIEDGYYSIRTYYQTEQNTETMMSLFNPVYAYLKAESGRYYLIKPVAPYYGMISNLGTPLENNFYKRFMTFTNINNYYTINMNKSRSKGKITKDYYPEYYEAGEYGNLTMEYHADSNGGKFYYIFDLGTTLDKDLIFSMFISGFMENNLKYPNLHGKMTLDYKHMHKLNKIDYKPLSGDSFNFKKEFMDYPGLSSDLNDIGSIDIYLKKYGIARDYYNFFYSVVNGNKKIHSHRIQIKPNSKINLANSRYQISTFTSNIEIFNYNGVGNLYVDKLSTTNLDANFGLRSTSQLLLGKTYNLNDKVDLKELFTKLVSNDIDFNKVTYKKAHKENGLIDLNNLEHIDNKSFNFSNEMTIVYSYLVDGNKKISIVNIKENTIPNVEIKDNNGEAMDTDKIYDNGKTASYPFLKYKYGDGEYNTLFGKYYIEEEYKGKGLNIARVLLVSENEYGTKLYKSAIPNKETFKTYGKKLSMLFDLRNEFDEIIIHSFEYKINKELKRSIIDEKNNILYESDVRYSDDDEIISLTNEYSYLLKNQSDFDDQRNKKYFLKLGETSFEYKLINYSINYEDDVENNEVNSLYDLNDIIDKINAKINNKFAVITLTYNAGKDKLIFKFLVNASLSGHTDINIMRYQSYFTNTVYYVTNLEVLGLSGNYIGNAKIDVYHSINGFQAAYNSHIFKKEEIGSGLKLIFYTPGEYILTIGINGLGHPFFVQKFNVQDINTDITIKYVSDSDHPFKDGSTIKEFKYNLLNPIITPDHTEFLNSNDLLLGYGYKNEYYIKGHEISNFIEKYNSSYITLKCIWDKGATLTVNYGDTGIPSKTLKKHGDLQHNYYFSFNEITPNKIPSDFKLLGYSSPIFDNGFISLEDSKKHHAFQFKGDAQIDLVFVKKVIVKYEINPELSSNYLANDEYYQGDYLKEKILNKVNEDYEFLGWYLKDDPTQTLIDYKTYKVEKDIILVAKFSHK